MPDPIAIVPAAGAGRRFAAASGDPNRVKLLATVADAPLLDRTIATLLLAGLTRVIVVVAPQSPLVDPREALQAWRDRRVRLTVNPDPARGMFSSIHAGLSEAAGGDPLLVLPGDMPFVARETVTAVLDAFARHGVLIVPRYGGRRGHPIAMPADLRPRLLACDATQAFNDVLRGLDVPRLDLDVDDAGILRDVDVPADLGAGAATPATKP
jgi:molybdenum cofactor cytidylyltransferase